MGRAKNTLNRSEVSSTPIKLSYSVTYESSSLTNYGITVKSGSNVPYSVNMSPGEMEVMNNYRTIRQLYYQQSITGSIGSASFWDPVWQSTAASGTSDATYYNFPTQLTGSILIFAIPSSQFGEQISRKSFIISSSGVGSQYMIMDDGNGNLVDSLQGNVKVGNLFYAQGIAVITNQEYATPPTVITELTTEAAVELSTEAGDIIAAYIT